MAYCFLAGTVVGKIRSWPGRPYNRFFVCLSLFFVCFASRYCSRVQTAIVRLRVAMFRKPCGGSFWSSDQKGHLFVGLVLVLKSLCMSQKLHVAHVFVVVVVDQISSFVHLCWSTHCPFSSTTAAVIHLEAVLLCSEQSIDVAFCGTGCVDCFEGFHLRCHYCPGYVEIRW